MAVYRTVRKGKASEDSEMLLGNVTRGLKKHSEKQAGIPCVKCRLRL